MKVVLTLNAGDVVIDVPGSRGVLVAPTAVDFGDQHPDLIAENFAAAGRVDLLKYLEHRDPETGRLVRYNALGTRVEVTEEQEEGLREFAKVREAVEEGIEEAFDVIDEETEDRISDKIAEKVARSTDAITSPSELAEEEQANPADIPPGPPQEQEQDAAPVEDQDAADIVRDAVDNGTVVEPVSDDAKPVVVSPN